MSDIANNRKALHEYHILDRLEAGIELRGTEVKSIRGGLVSMMNSFARIENGQIFLYGVDIQPYVRASFEQHDAKRNRRLLLHKREINKLFGICAVKGHTIVGLRMYWKDSHVKVELGIAKGKESSDKRAALKTKTTKREVDREISKFNRKHG